MIKIITIFLLFLSSIVYSAPIAVTVNGKSTCNNGVTERTVAGSMSTTCGAGWSVGPLPEVSATSSTLSITPNSIATPTSTELVTVGIPFSACTLLNTNSFKLLDDQAAEVPVFVKKTLSWHSRASCPTAARAIKVQFEFDATGGAKTYSWDLTGRNIANDRTEAAVSEIVTDRAATKGSYNEPRVFAISPAGYLVQSGIIPPTSVKVTSTHDDNYFPEKWEYDARDFNYVTSNVDDWLFDRTSATYRQAMRHANLEYYREAYLAHEFYVDRIETTGTNTTVTDYCVGGFDMGGKADTFGSGGGGCDNKYIYSEPIKLHLALTGDDSWTPAGPAETTRDGLFLRMADTIFTGAERCPSTPSCQVPATATEGFSAQYTTLGAAYTERKVGFGLQTMLNLCELTGDAATCSAVDTIVNNIHLHMTTNPDGLGNFGYLGHSWAEHEGSFIPWIGTVAASSTGTAISINNTVEDIGAVLVNGDAIRGKPTVLGGSDLFNTTLTSVSGGPTTWTLNVADSVTVSPGNSIKGGNQGLGATKYELKADRVFSPWQQSNIADGLWQYYNWTENATQKNKAKDILLGFANAVTAYALDGTRINSTTKTLIESTYGVTIFDSNITSKVGCGLTVAPYPRYVSSSLMATSAMNLDYATYMFQSGGFADQHIPELLFQISLGIYFETDASKKAAMQALASDSIDWFDRWSCTSGNVTNGSALNDPYRAYNWTFKPDPFGTYKWVEAQQ